MKVAIDYSDGHFSMMPARKRDSADTPEGWEWYSRGLVEIPNAHWEEYARFLRESARWHRIIGELDNKAHQQREEKR